MPNDEVYPAVPGSKGGTDKVAELYRRTLLLSLTVAMAAESFIFVVWGLILFPEGDPLIKFLWSVLICGLGMGSVVGSLVALLVVDRLQGASAITTTAILYALSFGVTCNLLCHTLDKNYCHYFGAAENPLLFIRPALLLAPLAGIVVGYLLFTENGDRLLTRVNL